MTATLVITGASKGIGKSTAALFLEQGWKVINLSRSACDLPGVVNISVDLADPNWAASNSSLIIDSLKDAAQICLVHNAAICESDQALDLDPEQLRRCLEINVVAPGLLNRIIQPLMQANSAIIYIGSTLSEKAVANTASYTTSKHALAGLMKATCQDLVNHPGIHTCMVCPGITETEMLMNRIENNSAILQAMQNMVAQQRLVKPEEIASMVWFCANNPVINGSILHGNLGQLEK